MESLSRNACGGRCPSTGYHRRRPARLIAPTTRSRTVIDGSECRTLTGHQLPPGGSSWAAVRLKRTMTTTRSYRTTKLSRGAPRSPRNRSRWVRPSNTDEVRVFHVKQTKSHISGAAHDQTLNRVDRTPDPQRVARSARAGFLHEPERRASPQHLGRRASPQHLGRAGGVNKRQNLSRKRHGISTAPSGRPRDRRPARSLRRPDPVHLRNVLCGSGRVL